MFECLYRVLRVIIQLLAALFLIVDIALIASTIGESLQDAKRLKHFIYCMRLTFFFSAFILFALSFESNIHVPLWIVAALCLLIVFLLKVIEKCDFEKMKEEKEEKQ